MPQPFKSQHLIGGEWLGDADGERRNPASLDEVVSSFPAGSLDLLDQAISAAVLAAGQWAATSAPTRGEILSATADALSSRVDEAALLLCREEGKTLSEARDEVGRSIRMFRFYAGETWRFGGQVLPSMTPRTHLYTYREPLGVVGVITPWNFPIAIPVWKIAPALAAGNTVVFKPASAVPGIATLLAQCFVKAGLPDGVLNLVYGPGELIGEQLTRDQRVDGISFTGSTEVGTQVNTSGAARMARVQLELGGKNAMVALPDADPSIVAALTAQSAFGVTGQACTAASRLIVLEENRDLVLDTLAEYTRSITVGDGSAEGIGMGPVVSASQLDSNEKHLARAVRDGARLLTGGNSRGLFMEPTILTDVNPKFEIAQEEVFGPILSVITVATLDDAVAVANGTKFGLVAGIITDDLSAALHFVDRSKTGVVKVNRTTTGTDLNAPYGGIKGSSNDAYREQGITAFEFYTRVKTAYIGF